MPELPEVETYIRELQPLLAGKTVQRVQVAWPRIIAAPTPESFAAKLPGRRFVAFARRGKYMLLGLDDGSTLVVHLRMTGALRLHPADAPEDKHTHVVFHLDTGERLHYRDPR
ncbi:MAG: formamidopyrimidine-DNA glycosylase, partial [Caldilineae bacterium]